MKKILFRADAKPSIGVGDLMSLVSLSEYFSKEGWECHFLVRRYHAAVSLMEKKRVSNVIFMDENISLDAEVDVLNNMVTDLNINVLFFEITERPLSDYRGVSSRVKKVCVDFDGLIPHDMELVINWDIDPENKYPQELYPNTRYLFGPEYVILPLSFYREEVKNRRYADRIERVLIAMGGADEFDLTGKIVNILVASGIDAELHVVVGFGYEKKKELVHNLEASGCRYVVEENVSNMLMAYLACDVAIGAGGLTSSELVASKTPAILIATYEHQIKRCQYFDNKGLVKFLGYKEFNPKELIQYVKNPIIPSGSYEFKTYEIVKMVNAL